jgi:hypothetical protein
VISIDKDPGAADYHGICGKNGASRELEDAFEGGG